MGELACYQRHHTIPDSQGQAAICNALGFRGWFSLVPRPFIQRVYRFQYNARKYGLVGIAHNPSPRAILKAIRAGVGWVWD